MHEINTFLCLCCLIFFCQGVASSLQLTTKSKITRAFKDYFLALRVICLCHAGSSITYLTAGVQPLNTNPHDLHEVPNLRQKLTTIK